MKIKHNKFRNTGLIYELLVKQTTADILSMKDSPAISILKKYYTGKSALVKEFKLYEFILKNKGINQTKAETILSTVTELSRKFDQNVLKKAKYNLIREIKEHYDLEDFFSIKVRDYKALAGLYCLMEAQNSSTLVDPQALVDNKITVLEHLTSNPQDSGKVKDTLVEEFSKYDKDLRLLTYKILLEKFNERYSSLNQDQKSILREFINSVDSTTKLRSTVNEEKEKIKTRILNSLGKVDDIYKIKLNEIVKGITPLSNKEKVDDETLTNLMHYYELVHELERL
jgi:hypothetical protein